MKRKIIHTSDGSTTIQIEDWDECYHSKHGAIQEAKHVFIKNGLALFSSRSISILEIGFGTGLNALITFLEAKKRNQKINYVAVEAYPVAAEERAGLNYVTELDAIKHQTIFEKMHSCNWDESVALDTDFCIHKRQQFFETIKDVAQYDLIYFDAFGYRVQPDLWSTAMFQKMYTALKNNGVLVTYAAKGVVRRSMIEVGFTVEKLQGPPGKREMLRATKK